MGSRSRALARRLQDAAMELDGGERRDWRAEAATCTWPHRGTLHLLAWGPRARQRRAESVGAPTASRGCACSSVSGRSYSHPGRQTLHPRPVPIPVPTPASPAAGCYFKRNHPRERCRRPPVRLRSTRCPLPRSSPRPVAAPSLADSPRPAVRDPPCDHTAARSRIGSLHRRPQAADLKKRRLPPAAALEHRTTCEAWPPRPNSCRRRPRA